MKTISSILFLFVFIIPYRGFSQENTSKNNSPNIIFIMSDDHGDQAISAYNDELIHTPNIDRIASEGAIFNNSFVTNSICAPSRAVMLTGKHSFVNGKVDNVQPFDWGQEMFPKLLQENGYQTALVGKIHLDGKPQGFDYSAVLPGQGRYYNPDFIIDGKKQQIHGHVTEITTQLALDWLEDREKNKPFLLLYHQKAPHREWLPMPRHFKAFINKEFPLPETLFDDYKGRGTAAKTAEMNILEDMNWAGDSKIPPEVMKQLGIEERTGWGENAYKSNLGRMDSTQRATWDKTYDKMVAQFIKDYPKMDKKELMQWRYQRYMQDYLACIAGVDEGVGDILDFLKENNLEENTIVVYTSDQGFYLGEHGWFDKRFMYEPSLKTPLLIRYPKEIKPNTTVDKMVQNIDYAPTLLDYAGVKIPEAIQGKSMKPLLENTASQWRDEIYYTYYEYPSIHMVKRHYGIRTPRYKLIHFYYDIDEWELYDLKKDPRELKNLYDDPQYAELIKQLKTRLQDLREKYGDSKAKDRKFLEDYLEAYKE